MVYFRHLIEYVFTVYLLYLQNVSVYDDISIISFCSHIQISGIEAIFSLIVSRRMSLMRLGYTELGLELFSFGKDHSHRPKRPPMEE